MRDLNECQAEVFRRSEKRIKERKRHRKHILLACIPLVLCMTLFSSFFFRGTEKAAPDALVELEAPMNSPNGNWDGSSPVSVIRVEVSGLDFSQTYTNTADIMLISDQLYSYGQSKAESYVDKESAAPDDQHSVIAESENGGTAKEEAPSENHQGSLGNGDLYGEVSDSTHTSYTITLVMLNGNKTQYYLADHTLKNLTTNQAYNLTAKQTEDLKDILGISDP